MCLEGGPELSSGGTGDVLAGVISALIAQKMNIIDACMLSVAAHARAGEIFKNKIGEIGLNASSLILTIRDLINK
jgi:NAD(P)H-hydrate repair Nnr-like enzyme with NAD(P)H-hydrate dehydratase domain